MSVPIRGLLALVALPALAQEAPIPEDLPLPRPARLVARVAGQGDSGQGSAQQVKLLWGPSEPWTLTLGAQRSDLASSAQAPSPTGAATVTTSTTLGAARAFGALELGARVEHTVASDLFSSDQWTFTPAYERGIWRIELDLSTRRTRFDRLTFTALPLLTPTGMVYVSGYADLALQDHGVGAQLECQAGPWRAYASHAQFTFGDYDAAVDVSRIRSGSLTGPAMYRLVAGRMEARMARLAAAHLDRGAALLERASTAGVEWNFALSRWGLEAGRDVDHFTGDPTDTLLAMGTWKATLQWSLDLQVGASRSDAFGTVRFLGLGVTWRSLAF